MFPLGVIKGMLNNMRVNINQAINSPPVPWETAREFAPFGINPDNHPVVACGKYIAWRLASYSVVWTNLLVNEGEVDPIFGQVSENISEPFPDVLPEFVYKDDPICLGILQNWEIYQVIGLVEMIAMSPQSESKSIWLSAIFTVIVAILKRDNFSDNWLDRKIEQISNNFPGNSLRDYVNSDTIKAFYNTYYVNQATPDIATALLYPLYDSLKSKEYLTLRNMLEQASLTNCTHMTAFAQAMADSKNRFLPKFLLEIPAAQWTHFAQCCLGPSLILGQHYMLLCILLVLTRILVTLGRCSWIIIIRKHLACIKLISYREEFIHQKISRDLLISLRDSKRKKMKKLQQKL